jgi:hypothetical protein
VLVPHQLGVVTDALMQGGGELSPECLSFPPAV